VVDRVGDPVLSRRLDELLEVLHIELAPFDAAQSGAARAAYADFGKGSGHPAGLSFGDCLAYGLATETGQPLLYVGDDFAQTDLRSALGTDQGDELVPTGGTARAPSGSLTSPYSISATRRHP
jgi:ribonuclease VapC